MKTTNFSRYLQKFFTEYMPGVAGTSGATVDSYRYTFINFLTFINHKHGVTADKVEISNLSYENVTAFLRWLEDERKNSVSTRNQRQAAINSFIRFLMYEYPDYLNEYQRILAIPYKKSLQKEISYAKADGISAFLSSVDRNTPNGLRDYVMFSILYTTGIRVSELINIRVKNVSLQEPYTLLVHGKGGKSRYVPLVKHVIPVIQDYITKNHYDCSDRQNEWLFKNHLRQQFTRQGVNYLVNKYKLAANKAVKNSVPDDFSPHKFRHSAAMALVESGVDLIYIRDLLGHVSVTTTEVYAKADSRNKREAIEAASKQIVAPQEAQWDTNSDLKEWLKGFNRR